MQLVIFNIEREIYGIDITTLDEIVRMMKINTIPRCPDFIEGVINLRGEVIPVVDIHKHFGHNRTGYTFLTRIIITTCEGRRIGFIVDSIKEIKEIETQKIHPTVIVDDKTKIVDGTTQIEDGKMVQVIKISNFLEKNQLDKLIKND